MNDLIQAQAGEILKQISTAIQTTGDFAQKELPDIAQQYIVYGRFSGIMAVVAFMIACVVSGIFLFHSIKNRKEDDFQELLYVPLGFGFLISLSLAYNSGQKLLLNIFAPKVWLILEIKNLFS